MMDRENAKAWLRRFGDLPDELRQQCKHGHLECSTTHKGKCFDDVIQAACNPPETAPARTTR